MNNLAEKINNDYQSFRALHDYLSDMESQIDYRRKSDIKNPIEFYDLIINVSNHLKNLKRDKKGNQIL
jgi:hypothetical protein